MKKYLILLVLFSSFAFAQSHYPETKATSGLYTIYVDGVAQTPQYSQLYTVYMAAAQISQTKPQAKVVVRSPDITFTTVWRSNLSSSASSSRSSSVSSSSLISCPATTIVPYHRLGGTAWVAGGSVNVAPNATVEFGPQPYTGTWSWSGCNVTGSVREQTVRTSTSCKIIATHTNTCGTKSTYEFSVNIGSVSSSSASSSSNQTLTVQWQHPTERENGEVLSLDEIDGYEIRQWTNNSYQSTLVGVVNSVVLPKTDGKIEVAVFDNHGIYSEFVEAK